MMSEAKDCAPEFAFRLLRVMRDAPAGDDAALREGLLGLLRAEGYSDYFISTALSDLPLHKNVEG